MTWRVFAATLKILTFHGGLTFSLKSSVLFSLIYWVITQDPYYLLIFSEAGLQKTEPTDIANQQDSDLYGFPLCNIHRNTLASLHIFEKVNSRHIQYIT